MEKTAPKERVFTPYQVFLIVILTFLQFTIILDFMVLSPLGDHLMKEMHLTPEQFGWVVSSYAISAGISSLIASGFTDRFDRKNLLIFFYTGFVIGTLFCALAHKYEYLLLARVFTGIFGGVIGSISFAIMTDLFAMQVRGRVMGFMQMAFAASQILGIPIGLYFADTLGWNFPFFMIVGLSIPVGVIIIFFMKPVNAHLALQTKQNPFHQLIRVASTNRYLKGFAATILLATGGFMLMPFGSAFSVNNLGVRPDQLFMIFMVTGIVSMIMGPIIGKASDKFGKYNLFVIGSIWSIIMVIYYCNLSVVPLWVVFVANSLLFLGVTARMISSSALLSGVPEPRDRGTFMSVNASVQYIAGGIATAIAGQIVYRASETSPLENYPILGYVVAGTTVITIIMMYFLNQMIMRTQPDPTKPV